MHYDIIALNLFEKSLRLYKLFDKTYLHLIYSKIKLINQDAMYSKQIIIRETFINWRYITFAVYMINQQYQNYIKQIDLMLNIRLILLSCLLLTASTALYPPSPSFSPYVSTFSSPNPNPLLTTSPTLNIRGGSTTKNQPFANLPQVNSLIFAMYPALRAANLESIKMNQDFVGIHYTLVYKLGATYYQAEVLVEGKNRSPRLMSMKVLTVGTKQPQKVTNQLTTISTNGVSTKSQYNGATHNGNYIWGGAMNLAWNELMDSYYNGNSLPLNVSNAKGRNQVDNFNKRPFTKQDLSSDSYYVKSGYGQETVQLINKEVNEKFPNRTFGNLTMQLRPRDVVSYAYFTKNVQYPVPFAKEPNFVFAGNNVKGFKAANQQQKDNVEIIKYNNNDDFVIRLKVKQPNDELYIIKGNQNKTPDEISKMILNPSTGVLGWNEEFKMPIVDLNVNRNYNEIIGSTITSGQLRSYTIAAMYENIKFLIDETGATVENEGVIGLLGSVGPGSITRKFILDKPFWIVMKQKDSTKPYFITQINNTNFMKTG